MRRCVAGLSLLILVMAGAAACTSGADSAASTDHAATPATGVFQAPTKKQLARGVRLGDQTDQFLAAVAAHGSTVVAVGADTSSNVTRPLFVVSSDGGRTWRRGSVEGDSLPDDLGDSAADEVVRGDDEFLASGTRSNGVPALWTSTDGLEWTMVETADLPFTPQDTVDAITWANGTYLAAGVNSRRAGKASDRVIVWRGKDATSWQRHDLAKTVRDVPGSPSVADIAVAGKRVLVAGTYEDNTITDQPDRLALWLSTDSGRSFHLERTSRQLGGGYRAYSQAVAVARGEFHIAASGDGLSETLHGRSSWDPVVVSSSPDGWTTQADPAMSSVAQEHPATIFQVGQRWVIATNSAANSGDAAVYAGSSYQQTARLRAPSLTGRGDQYVADGVAVGDRAILVGFDSRSGSTEPAVWQLKGDELSVVDLPSAVSSGEPSVAIDQLVATERELVAVGSSANSPVAWRADETISWRAQGLPGRSERVESVWINDAVAVGRRVVAVGIVRSGHGGDGSVWIRGKKGTWRQITPSTLSLRDDGGYGSVNLTAVAGDGKDLIATANRYVNGADEIRPFYSHDAGRTWHTAFGTNEVPLSDSDEFFGVTRFTDFRAPQNGTVSVNDVIHADQGWVMGGGRSRAGKGARPVVWRSDTGFTWSEPTALPMPDHAYSANVSVLSVSADQVLAAGSVSRRAADPEPSWISWVSDDGGKTWQIGTQVATSKVSVGQVLEVDGGYLALGGVGAWAARDTAAWVSADGLSWREVDLGLAHPDGPGGQYLTHGVVHDGELHVVAADIRPTGGTLRAQSVAVPEVE